MSVRQKAVRVATIGFAVFGCALAIIGVVLIATGRFCITSPRRLTDQYGSVLAESRRDGESPAAGDPATAFGSDADADGIDDNDDVLAAALAYAETRPHYKSAYYASGYPDDEFGVCTDVVATACRASGYDLQALVAADVAMRPNAYAIDGPDPAIYFRRTPNLEVFFNAHAQRLTTDADDVAEWRGGDIVLYRGHVGIVSDRRNAEGVPYLIHHSGPFQLRYEEDKLEGYGRIIGHYRLNPAYLALLS